MNNFIGLDTRNRRNLNTTFPPIHVPVSNYSTKAQTKENMNDTYNAMFLNDLHLIPDPLKKNLADSVITEKDIGMKQTNEYIPKEVEKPLSGQTSDFYPRLRNIISGVINVMGAMFQWRDSSPASQYYDCFDSDFIENSDEPMSGSVPWQSASRDVQNKNSWYNDNNETNWNSDMMSNCSPALTDDQINQVCLLLNGKSNYIHAPNSKLKPFESSSVDVFEDAFSPDELSISGDSYLEYHSPLCYQEELFNSYASNKDKSKLNKENIDLEEAKEMSPKPENKECVVLSEPVREISPILDNSGSVGEMSPKVEIRGSVGLLPPTRKMSPVQDNSDSEGVLQPAREMSPKLENSGSAGLLTPAREMSPLLDNSGSEVLQPAREMSPKQENSGSAELLQPVREMSPQSELNDIGTNLVSNNVYETHATVTKATSVSELGESQSKLDIVQEDLPNSNKSEIISTIKDNVVSSCEDKLNRLKALLKSKCSKQNDNAESDDNSVCTVTKPVNIVCDTIFADEITFPSTSCLRLAEPFNEVTGKFYSSSVESDDSFQIVFTDDAKESRCRIPSECESEDSFIVFEESPDSCYISDDVFGTAQIHHCSDSETSDSEDDSGYELRLCPAFSRTVEDLTDCQLYDEVDSSTVIGQHYDCSMTTKLQNEDATTSKHSPHKKVHFSSEPPKVHVMRVWAFAARQARIGEWEQHARDRERFKSRINDVEMAISWVLKPQHRKLVMFQRFMPWWNAQKRKEQEEKKQRELEQIKQQEEQKVEDKEDKVELDKDEILKDKNDNIMDKNENLKDKDENLKDKNENRLFEKEKKLNKTGNTEKTHDTSVPNEKIIAEDNTKLYINEKKAPDRTNSQEIELDSNAQFANELQIPCDVDVNNDSACTDMSSEGDR